MVNGKYVFWDRGNYVFLMNRRLVEQLYEENIYIGYTFTAIRSY